MKTMSKLALAFLGLAGVAMTGQTVQASEINGAGSSAGRLFAGDSPAAICQTGGAHPTPLLFVSSETPVPNKYEWQCDINNVLSIVRYSASNSVNGYLKLPNGSVATDTYLVTAGCPVGVPTVILGKTVNRSVCPAGTPTQTLPVHWGGADVKASSLHQTIFGATTNPPAAGHLSPVPTVIVPFSIVVGGNVRAINPTTLAQTNLVTLTEDEIRQIMDANVTNWTDLGYDTTTADKTIVVCHRTTGSGTLATLDETLMRPKFWGGNFPGAPSATIISNAGSSNMATCLGTNPNAIGYIDSDSVPGLLGGAYQIAIGGQPINDGALGTGKARLKALRCGRYPYWADWNFVKRTAGVEGAPYTLGVNTVAGNNAAVNALQTAMQTNNPLLDFWLSEDDTFVFKNDDRGPHNWFTPSNNGENIATVCTGAASPK